MGLTQMTFVSWNVQSRRRVQRARCLTLEAIMQVSYSAPRRTFCSESGVSYVIALIEELLRFWKE